MRATLSKTKTDRGFQRWQIILDTIIIVGITAILALIYYRVPTSIQHQLALDHTDPAIHGLWTRVLVHEPLPDDGHLLGNLFAYFLVVIPARLLCLGHDQRKRFWPADCS